MIRRRVARWRFSYRSDAERASHDAVRAAATLLGEHGDTNPTQHAVRAIEMGGSGVLLIDAANVVGSRPTGWWKDRAKAAADLVQRLRAAALTMPAVVVLEGAARQGAEPGVADGVEVVHAPGSGDDTLVEIAAAAAGPVVLVSADRALGERCRAVGATVVGPTWLLDVLPES